MKNCVYFKRLLVVVMAAVALCVSGQVERPKLVVGVVVDQMRWDYLYTYQWGEGGFKTLMHDGYLCNNTIIDYVPTVTAIGHASIYTGTTPAFHGIAGNDFMLNGKSVTSVRDDTEQGIGGNEKTRGKSPRNLITTTIADQLQLATDFKSRTVGIALKDRAAILPSGHHPIGAYWYDGGSKAMVTSTYYMTNCPNGSPTSTRTIAMNLPAMSITCPWALHSLLRSPSRPLSTNGWARAR